MCAYLMGYTLTVAHNIDRLVQERRNSSASAMELRLFCTNPKQHVIISPLLAIAQNKHCNNVYIFSLTRPHM